jgi:DNA-binding MarR family transcriptional regulator
MLAAMARQQAPTTNRERQLAAASLLLRRHSEMIGEMTERVIATSSPHDLSVLSHLRAHPAQRPHALMAVTGLGRPSVAAVVARLERLGLVERRFGELDRRTMLASLTARGRRRMAGLEQALEQHFADSGSQVREILGLLGCTEPVLSERGDDDTAIAAVGRLADAGAAYEAGLDARLQTLSGRQHDAILALLADGPARPKQLAETLQLSSGGLTYVIDQLEAEGFVTRSYGTGDDRRSVVVELSASGLEHGRAMCAALAANAEAFCAALSRPMSTAASSV